MAHRCQGGRLNSRRANDCHPGAGWSYWRGGGGVYLNPRRQTGKVWSWGVYGVGFRVYVGLGESGGLDILRIIGVPIRVIGVSPPDPPSRPETLRPKT